MDAVVQWKEGMRFEGKAGNSMWVPMDQSSPDAEKDRPPAPMQLALISLGGCTGMDIAWVLNKKRIKFDKFWVEISSESADTHPKIYTSIHLKFIVVGQNVPLAAVERAARLSHEKYCSVGAMLGKAADITYEVEVRES